MNIKQSPAIKLCMLLFLQTLSNSFAARAQTYHTSNTGTLVSNIDANQQLNYGTYDFQIGNGSGNTNFPAVSNAYGNLINFSSTNFLSQFLSVHNSTPELFFRTAYYGANYFSNWNKMIIEHDNTVGIGTNSPENSEGWMKVLEVKGAAHSKSLVSTNNVISGLWSHELGYYGAPAGGISGTYTNHPFSFITNKVSRMTITNDGRVGIGVSDPPSNFKLAVAGKVIADELKVKPHASGWPDYVFKPQYQLMPLSQVEDFIKEKGHLPEVPSAKEVENEGIALGANQALLLKKIEELTLYLIEKDRQLLEQKKANEKLEKRLTRLEVVMKSLQTDNKLNQKIQL
jgi:hypothetical protein